MNTAQADQIGRAFQYLDQWGTDSWNRGTQAVKNYWVIRNEYTRMRKELQHLRRDNREVIGLWMHAEIELQARPRLRCRRRLQPVVRFLVGL